MSERCKHGLIESWCARCDRPVGDPTRVEADDEDRPQFPPRPERTWGGEHTVPHMGKDDKYVRIPSAMQYIWPLLGREDLGSKLSAIAFSHVKRTAERKSMRMPTYHEREDIAQDGLLQFMEWLMEQDDKGAAVHDIKTLCFYVGKAYFQWLEKESRSPDTRPIDWETGTELNIVERWAEPGTYLPFMGLLTEARNADEPTPAQEQLLKAWALFDPDFEGRITRNLSEQPLNNAERMILKRARAWLNPDEEKPASLRGGEAAARAAASIEAMLAA